jgi:hypothetical protein
MVTSGDETAGGSAAEDADTNPLWTIRCTWAVLTSEDQPTYTYATTGSETEAIDRAVFALDRYDNSGERILIAAHVKRADGWAEVPRPSSSLARHGHLYAFQRPPERPP